MFLYLDLVHCVYSATLLSLSVDGESDGTGEKILKLLKQLVVLIYDLMLFQEISLFISSGYWKKKCKIFIYINAS